jgi:transporter family-2 protein
MHAMHIQNRKMNFTFAVIISISGPETIRKDLTMQAQSSITLLAAALLAGAVVPFQAGANAAIGRALGHPLWATVVSLGVSMLCVIPVMLAMKVSLPAIGNAAGKPLWIWSGGLAGVIYITAAILVAPKFGAAGFMTAVIAGQIGASLLIDTYGLMGFSAREITPSRLIGVGLVVAGVAVMQAPSLLRAASTANGTSQAIHQKETSNLPIA